MTDEEKRSAYASLIAHYWGGTGAGLEFIRRAKNGKDDWPMALIDHMLGLG